MDIEYPEALLTTLHRMLLRNLRVQPAGHLHGSVPDWEEAGHP